MFVFFCNRKLTEKKHRLANVMKAFSAWWKLDFESERCRFWTFSVRERMPFGTQVAGRPRGPRGNPWDPPFTHGGSERKPSSDFQKCLIYTKGDISYNFPGKKMGVEWDEKIPRKFHPMTFGSIFFAKRIFGHLKLSSGSPPMKCPSLVNLGHPYISNGLWNNPLYNWLVLVGGFSPTHLKKISASRNWIIKFPPNKSRVNIKKIFELPPPG